MRILSCVARTYFHDRNALDVMYLAFTEPLRSLGHHVDHFDHRLLTREIGAERTAERFLATVRSNGYDAILYQTGNKQADALVEVMPEAGRYAPAIAWNSDDDWKWEEKTSRMAPFFTFMFTTRPEVYEQNRARVPNLRLSQWGCLDGFGDFGRAKDLDFTFVGQIWDDRIDACRYLARRAGLQVYGYMSGRVTRPAFLFWPGIRKLSFRIPAIAGRPLSFEGVNEIWNRSRISYTPMEASGASSVVQIKSRTFEQGLSGTMVVCRESPYLDRYYEPEKELVVFETLDDCAEKVKFYLAHESERARIARAYHDRTRSEHMWTHRFRKMFEEIGL